MSKRLQVVVREPFGDYVTGHIITDAKLIKALRESHPSHLIVSELDEEFEQKNPPPAPVEEAPAAAPDTDAAKAPAKA